MKIQHFLSQKYIFSNNGHVNRSKIDKIHRK